MKFAIVFTGLLALAAAATLPADKPDSQNELVPAADHEDVLREQEERDSIAASFAPIVQVVRRYKAHDGDDMTDEIIVPDTVYVGSRSDTYLSGVRVKGLKDMDAQNIDVSWKEGLVRVENGWPKLAVNGAYQYVSPATSHTGVFEIVLIEPRYFGNTSLARNANPSSVSPAGWFTMKRAVIDHSEMPEVFGNEKPQFEKFVKNVVSQYVAAAVSAGMYNDVVAELMDAAKPYLKYRSETIATGDHGNDDGGYELKNVRVDDHKNNLLAKVYDVQMNKTGDRDTAKFQLRLLDLTGQCDWSGPSGDGKATTAFGTLKFKMDRVTIVPALNFADKTVHTDVYVKSPAIDVVQSADRGTLSAKAKERLTEDVVKYLVRALAGSTSEKIQNAM